MRRPRRSPSGSRKSPSNSAVGVLTADRGDLAAILDQFLARYSNPATARVYRHQLARLFRYSGRRHPSQLTETDLLTFCTRGEPANNTVYQRTAYVCTFLRWCERSGLVAENPSRYLREPDSPLRTYKRTYGKVQDRNPGHWLTYEQAFGQLVGACQDGTLAGLRDEIAVRLGLAGMRLSEIVHLPVGAVTDLPTIRWTGKGHKPRKAIAGGALQDALGQWLDQYPTPQPTDALLCRRVPGPTNSTNRIRWRSSLTKSGVAAIIANRAKAAGLGQLAPHDLRRTAAGILDRATDEHGAHHFDLLDIQKVLGHADPATTMRSYLDPMDTEVLDRAAAVLD
jgi:integrase/recombinase XerD